MDSWDKGSRRRVPRRQAPLTVRSPTPVWVKPDTNRPGGSDAWPTSSTSVPQHVSWTFRISSGVSEGIDKSVVQSDWEFLRIGVDSRR